VRCQARRAPRLIRNSYDFAYVEQLLEEYRLLERDIQKNTNAEEGELIGALGLQMGRAKNYLDNIEPLAKALADGLSLEGAGEALSIGAAAAYISTSYGNPMDSHLHTGTNNRRYLLNQPDVSLRNKLLGLLTGFTGPEVLLAERLLNWEDNLDSEVTKSLPDRNQEQLLDAIAESIDSQPWLDWRKIGVAETVAPDSVKDTVALARQYAERNYDTKAYFDLLAEIACRDNDERCDDRVPVERIGLLERQIGFIGPKNRQPGQDAIDQQGGYAEPVDDKHLAEAQRMGQQEQPNDRDHRLAGAGNGVLGTQNIGQIECGHGDKAIKRQLRPGERSNYQRSGSDSCQSGKADQRIDKCDADRQPGKQRSGQHRSGRQAAIPWKCKPVAARGCAERAHVPLRLMKAKTIVWTSSDRS